ncbi:MAG TPA: sigma 54-interacting transcriptional regulator [Myxococcales bacterium]|nr:sigma 54-interacting transcriptional regulator [Myxococcales bacterium]
MSEEQKTAELSGLHAPGPGDRLALLAFADGAVTTFPLPQGGEVVIGRSREADLFIDASSLSRRHAVLDIGPAAIRLKDLGSSNGTKVRNRALAPDEWVPVGPGDSIELGDVLVVLQRGHGTLRARRVWSHAHFEGRLEDECARGAAELAVVRIRVEGDGAPPAAAAEALGLELRPGECAAAYAPGEYELLLCTGDPERAAARADEFVARLEDAGLSAWAGVACFPRDGRDPERLVAQAGAELRSARGGGAGDRPGADAAEGAPVIADPAMVQLYRLIDKVAAGSINVLVLGETGVGKELVAEAVHQRSPRAGKPFVRINCAALSESLLESELFGHERGAFTGAVEAKPGLLEAAGGGTVLLDEVGELPLSTQAKLLRVLEERSVRRVGAIKPRPIDARFVAATNRGLEAEVDAGRFRKDLYFRLAGVALVVPPLRERRQEIAPLAASFARIASRQLGRGGGEARISPQAMQRLEQYAWPGNIRELRNAVERAVLLAGGGPVDVEHLPLEKMAAVWLAPAAEPPPAAPPAEGGRASAERQRIVDALQRCAGNQTQAARLLGISRRTLLYRLDEYGLPRPQKRSRAPEGA